MTARTRAIERKLVEWFRNQRGQVDCPSGAWKDPTIHVAEQNKPGKITPGYDISLTRLATAIELGEIS